MFTVFAGSGTEPLFGRLFLLLPFFVFLGFDGGGGFSLVGLESRGRGGGDEGPRDLARVIGFARRIGRQVG